MTLLAFGKPATERCALTLAGVLLLSVATSMPPASTLRHRTVTAQLTLLSGEELSDITNGIHGSGPGVALFMGGSGVPIPPPGSAERAFDLFLAPKGFGDYTLQPVYTPEGLQPFFTDVNSLSFDPSVAQGVEELNTTIESELEAGHNVVVGGVSQSSTINAIEMQDIVNGSLGPDFTLDKLEPGQLQFVSFSDPSAPNGGLVSRFDLPIGSHPTIPSLGITFDGAAPADTGIPTDIYAGEYDPISDYPEYPMNLVSDINSFAALVEGVHSKLVESPDAAALIPTIVTLSTTPGYDGGTEYYMLPTPSLPLTELLQPIIGKPLADLLEPDLRVVANLGYGSDPDVGWSQSPANLATPIGVFPSIDSAQFQTIVQALGAGATQGFHDFIADLSHPSSSVSAASPSPLLNLFDSAPDLADADHSRTLGDVGTNLSIALSSVIQHVSQVLFATEEIANAIITRVPAQDLSLFTTYLDDGDLMNAIGLPVAENTGLVSLAVGIEALVVVRQLDNIEGDLAPLQTDISGLFG